MRTFFKTMVGLLLTLPLGAYFAGSYVASHYDQPTNARLVRVDHNTATDKTGPADTTAKPARRPSRRPPVGRPPSGSPRPSDDSSRDDGWSEHSREREDWHWSGQRDHADQDGGWNPHRDGYGGGGYSEDDGWSQGGDFGGDPDD